MWKNKVPLTTKNIINVFNFTWQIFVNACAYVRMQVCIYVFMHVCTYLCT